VDHAPVYEKKNLGVFMVILFATLYSDIAFQDCTETTKKLICNNSSIEIMLESALPFTYL